ncbi:MAG: translational GTPase TypA [Oscillospiraceae bacterium]
MQQKDIRNIAIVAHVDHGKTTLVDQMLKQSGTFRSNQVVEDRVLDSGAIERERGITILSKNTSVVYKGTKINIVDTPGHADFGGEVERVLKMVNGVLLLVDAAEGPMPQTRFVLEKALSLGHKIIVVINKIDRPDARIYEVVDEVLDLLIDLNATEEQLDSPVIFCSGREGKASLHPDGPFEDLSPLFDTIVSHFDPPSGDPEGPLQMLVSTIDYNDYVGRICIGRIERGTIRKNQDITIAHYHKEHEPYNAKAVNIYTIEGLNRVPVESASAGEIICLSGAPEITIGDTICDPEHVETIPFVKISDPTIEMTFSVNDSPFAGREGKYVTSRHLRERLYRELLRDVSLRVTDTDSTESFRVAGRGEMHLSVLIETMRREGYELSVGAPKVLTKEIDGKTCEPYEEVICDVPQEYVGSVMQKLGERKGELRSMNPIGNRMRLNYLIPTRGMFGYRNEFLTDTHGEGIMSSVFDSYGPIKGDIPTRTTGSLIAFETGEAVVYGMYNAQQRGVLFITPGTEVYEGMIVGESPKPDDIVVNVCKKKHQTNIRAAGSDDALRLTPPKDMSLDSCIEYIASDELVEVTPKSIRMRKKILSKTQRAKVKFGNKK